MFKKAARPDARRKTIEHEDGKEPERPIDLTGDADGDADGSIRKYQSTTSASAYRSFIDLSQLGEEERNMISLSKAPAKDYGSSRKQNTAQLKSGSVSQKSSHDTPTTQSRSPWLSKSSSNSAMSAKASPSRFSLATAIATPKPKAESSASSNSGPIDFINRSKEDFTDYQNKRASTTPLNRLPSNSASPFRHVSKAGINSTVRGFCSPNEVKTILAPR